MRVIADGKDIERAVYSDSIVDVAMHGCNLEHQNTGQPIPSTTKTSASYDRVRICSLFRTESTSKGCINKDINFEFVGYPIWFEDNSFFNSYL